MRPDMAVTGRGAYRPRVTRNERPLPAMSDARPSAVVGSREPSRFEWLVTVFSLVVQQGAFISVPLAMRGDSFRVTVNPANTMAVSACMVLLALVFFQQRREVASLAGRNLTSILFLTLVLLSATWSIHPDITVRRGVGYLLTIALACYVAVRFTRDDRMRVLSLSFAISAVGSLAFVAMLPQYGIMHVGDLAGAWRGVFPHKNVLGPVMAVAIFVESYLIVVEAGGRWWRFAFVALYSALVILSHSATAMLLSLLYAAGACGYVLWKRHRLAAAAVLMNGVLALIGAAVAFWNEPSLALSAIGKDPTLTGRTTLWEVVFTLIRERPWLGWGYHAMWVLNDPTTIFADKMTGNWGVTSSHNAFLELTLQLGLAGLGAMLLILGVALWRAIQCCRGGEAPLGWFSLVFVVGALLAAGTVETLGQSQDIAWVVFNVLMFGCGLELLAMSKRRVAGVFRMRSVVRRGEGQATDHHAFVTLG